MLNNPIIQRYRYSLLRPSHFLVYVAIYISVVVLLLFFNYTLYKYQETFRTPEDLCKGIYYQFLAFQIIVLWFWGAFNSASAIKEEITGKTYDFFRMLPLAARQKTIGILLGKNLVVLLLGAISCLFLVFFGSFGGISFNLQVQILLVLLSITILVNSIALLSSINLTQKAKKTNVFVFILFAFFFAPFFLMRALGSLSETEKLEKVIARFFEIKLPVLILVSLIALYFSCWAIKGTLRRFTREDEPLFTRKGAFLFMLGFEVVLLGLFYHYIRKEEIEVSYSYWTISLLAVFAVPLGALRNFDKYLEYSGLIREKSASKLNITRRILLHSNISLVLGLFIIWSAGSLVTILISRMELFTGLYRIWVLFSFYIFFMLLLELNILYKPLSPKIVHLLFFIAGVYVIFPLILSAILESEIIYLYSPLGFFWEIMYESQRSTPSLISTPLVLTGVWVVNALLCAIPILLIKKRYSDILILRQKM